VEISKSVTLQDLLTHLYVLIPVLDSDRTEGRVEASVSSTEWMRMVCDRSSAAPRSEPNCRCDCRQPRADPAPAKTRP
jgi:hypothetical protein